MSLKNCFQKNFTLPSKHELLISMHAFSVMLFALSLLALASTSSSMENTGSNAIIPLEESTDNAESEENVRFLNEGDKTFIPTDKWQPVKPGQQIPAGLHVRLNLKTGEREAKLMESTNAKSPEDRSVKGDVDEMELSRERIRQALERFGSEMDDVKDEEVKKDAVKTKFRSYDELKREMKEMEVEVKTDWETIEGLVQRFNSSERTLSEKLLILEDLEYYMHQVDNAVDFSKNRGLEFISATLNSSESELQSAAALALAAAVQGNSKVQIAVVEAGLGPQLLRLVANSADVTVRTRSLAALSGFLRHFPWAQTQFFKWGGLSALATVFATDEVNEKLSVLQSKVIAFVSNLYDEKMTFVQSTAREDKQFTEKLKQYESVDHARLLQEAGWCTHLSNQLKKAQSHDHSGRERVLRAANVMRSLCRVALREAEGALQTLEVEYRQLELRELKEDGEPGYFSELRSLIEQVLAAQAKDEL